MSIQIQKADSDDIVLATRSYEKWLSGFMEIVPDALALKHTSMAALPFTFLRATYYRWAQLFPIHCAELAEAPQILSIGDLHVDNFGTWRDAESRLVWGVNDFDETAKLPYTNDLVRLALSAKLALDDAQLSRIDWSDACAAILEGYGDAMADAVDGGQSVRPIVLAESYGWLAHLASAQALDPEKFWSHLFSQSQPLKPMQRLTASSILKSVIPEGSSDVHWKQRSAGEGSLGRPRYVAIADWQGGRIAREAKALCPSAAYWAGASPTKTVSYGKIVGDSVRSPDPFLHIAPYRKSEWVVRRLSPDCRRLEMAGFNGSIDDKLFHAMGHETANIHMNQRKRCKAIHDDFTKRGPNCDWLTDSALAMEKCLIDDFVQWRAYWHENRERA